MKKLLVLSLLALLAFAGCATKQNKEQVKSVEPAQSESEIFVYGDSESGFPFLGRNVGNEVHFYGYDYDWETEQGEWKKNSALTLPSGYKSLFYYGVEGGSLGVVTAGEIQFYEYDYNWETEEGEWKKISTLTLPTGYKSLFQYRGYFEGYSVNGALGVVTAGEILFYGYESDEETEQGEWKKISTLTLPSGYKSLFLDEGSFGVGVVTDAEIQFYENGEQWERNADMNFPLPSGYKSLCGYNGTIGVVTAGEIQFYSYDGENDAAMNFPLPSGYKSLFSKGTYLGVEVNNEIQFYEYNQEQWERDGNMTFTIPSK